MVVFEKYVNSTYQGLARSLFGDLLVRLAVHYVVTINMSKRVYGKRV